MILEVLDALLPIFFLFSFLYRGLHLAVYVSDDMFVFGSISQYFRKEGLTEII